MTCVAPTMCASARNMMLRSTDHVCKFNERYHPHPTPPQPHPNFIYINPLGAGVPGEPPAPRVYIYIFTYHQLWKHKSSILSMHIIHVPLSSNFLRYASRCLGSIFGGGVACIAILRGGRTWRGSLMFDHVQGTFFDSTVSI